MQAKQVTKNDKVLKYDFMGGKISLVPAGVMPADKTNSGEDEAYQASVKIHGISRFPQKIPRTAIEKIVEIFSTEEGKDFLQTLL